MIQTQRMDHVYAYIYPPQTAYKLLELYVRLRELGHPQYVQLFGSVSLACSISREEADRRVSV